MLRVGLLKKRWEKLPLVALHMLEVQALKAARAEAEAAAVRRLGAAARTQEETKLHQLQLQVPTAHRPTPPVVQDQVHQ